MMTHRFRRWKAIGVALLVFLNGPAWRVLSKASDIDFLVNSIQKARPHTMEFVSVIRDWGWLGGVALLLWVAIKERRSSNTPIEDVDGGIKVRATQTGYYGDILRREGDVFTIESEQQFSKKWMERVADDTPEQHTTSAEALRRTEAELRGRNPNEADQMRINDLDRVVSSLSSERDALKSALEQTQMERETLRGELGTTKATLAESRAEVGLCKLERLGRKYLKVREDWNATVTVRFIDYNADGLLADRVADLFARYTKWTPKRIKDDGSEIRRPHGMSRVMFESGTPELVQELASIFNEGNLLKEPVSGREIHDRDDYDVVVTIFPRNSSDVRA
jgi:hypothetical protein